MKTIIVAFDGTEGAVAALATAAKLTKRSDGHVVAVMAHASAEAYAVKGHWIPAQAREIMAQANQQILSDAENAFQQAVDRLHLGDRVSFEKIGGRVDDVLARRARTADLLVLARPEAETDMHMVQHPDQIVMRSGRPLLVLPKGSGSWTNADAVDAGPVVVAWDGKRAAARALGDAVPLLQPGTEIVLLTVGVDTMSYPDHNALAYLERHGFTARHEINGTPPQVTQSILAFCDVTDPSLLVMGAYEHSKFQVDLTGAPTAQILRQANLPVLMAH
ncbi:MAG: universal stress protein [Pseudomonadota bacterium]